MSLSLCVSVYRCLQSPVSPLLPLTPYPQVKHALTRDGMDPAIAEMDPEELIPGPGACLMTAVVVVVVVAAVIVCMGWSVCEVIDLVGRSIRTHRRVLACCLPLSTGGAAAPAAAGMVKRKEHPTYKKYFMMLKIGQAVEQVRGSFVCLSLCLSVCKCCCSVSPSFPLTTYPQVKHALTRDGMDPAIAEMDPEELIPGPGACLMTAVVVVVVVAAVIVCMGWSVCGVIDLVGRSIRTHRRVLACCLPLSTGGAAAPAAAGMVKRKEHPTYKKYFMMLKIGQAVEQVRGSFVCLSLCLSVCKCCCSVSPSFPLTTYPQVKHALTRDGMDPAIAEMDPEELIPGPGACLMTAVVVVVVVAAVIVCMGWSVCEVIDLVGRSIRTHRRVLACCLPLSTGGAAAPAAAGMVKRKEHPTYKKYFMMLKIGQAVEQVRVLVCLSLCLCVASVAVLSHLRSP